MQRIEDKHQNLAAKIDNLSVMMISGFTEIQVALQALSSKLDAANLTKGEKGDKESEPVIQETSGSKGEQRSKGELGSEGEPRSKGEPSEGELQKDAQSQGETKCAEDIRLDENLVEVEINGEICLVSKEALKEIEGSQRVIQPPVQIREPALQPQESAAQRVGREKEEQNKLEKGKEKLPEYVDVNDIWSERTELNEVEANTVMLNHMESTLNNSDEQFSRIIEEVRLASGGELEKFSNLLRSKIISISVQVNQKNRWAVYVYLETRHSIFITLHLLQSLSARVLHALASKVKAGSQLNEILLTQIQGLIDEKLPEVELEPFVVFYSHLTKDGPRKIGFVNHKHKPVYRNVHSRWPLTFLLLLLLAASCFLASFTDSYKASNGQVY